MLSCGCACRTYFTAHNISGEKDRKHPHYLKGSIFCGDCGARLIYSRNRGHGGEYEYFTCLSRRTGRRPCTRRPMRLEKIEDGIARLYAVFQVSPELAATIHTGVLDELAADREQATRDTERAKRRITRLKDERKKLLTTHCAGAVPLDMLKDEMERLTGEMADAEAAMQAAVLSVADLEGTLGRALAIASNCAGAYLAVDVQPAIRRMFNQGLFVALYLGQDGAVERFELTEPFATLLDRNLLTDLAEEREAGRHATGVPEQAELAEMPSGRDQDRNRPSNVLTRCFACPSTHNSRTGSSGWVCTRYFWCPRQDSNLRQGVRQGVDVGTAHSEVMALLTAACVAAERSQWDTRPLPAHLLSSPTVYAPRPALPSLALLEAALGVLSQGHASTIVRSQGGASGCSWDRRAAFAG